MEIDICAVCMAWLEEGEFVTCGACDDEIARQEAEEDFYENRFDMETEREYQLRRENKW